MRWDNNHRDNTWDGTNTSLRDTLQDILNRLTALEGGNV